jgi:hypothetical protein
VGKEPEKFRGNACILPVRNREKKFSLSRTAYDCRAELGIIRNNRKLIEQDIPLQWLGSNQFPTKCNHGSSLKEAKDRREEYRRALPLAYLGSLFEFSSSSTWADNPGESLDFRHKVKDELERPERGYEVIIMEDLPEMATDSALDEKFERILDKYEPFLFVAFFEGGADTNGVSFEVGFISCRYGSINIGDRIAFLGEQGYSWDYSPAYIRASLSKVKASTYDETDEHYKASQKVHFFVAGMINKQNLQDQSNPVFDSFRRALRLRKPWL